MDTKVTIEIIFDDTHGRTNLAFSGKPSEEVRKELKANGWLWSSRNKVWYPRKAEGSTEFAHNLQEKYFAEQVTEKTSENNKFKMDFELGDIKKGLHQMIKDHYKRQGIKYYDSLGDMLLDSEPFQRILKEEGVLERDFNILSKEEYLKKYPFVTEEQYEDELEQKYFSIFEKYANTHFTENEKDELNNLEKVPDAKEQVEYYLRNGKFFIRQLDNDGYLTEDGQREISAQEARNLLGEAGFISGLDRASFHVTSTRQTSDGQHIWFDCISRDGEDKNPAYELTDEDKRIIEEYHNNSGKNLFERFGDVLGNEQKQMQIQESVPQEQTADPKITKGTAKKIREQCRQILQKPDSEITEADKKILAAYEGAGGLHEENQSASGVLSEFYTPKNIIDATWQLVDYYAPDAKTVLEPSAGTGRFARGRDDKEFTMHELDETSARIARLLHPEAKVIQGAYQKQFFDENERFLNKNYEQPKYDIVIGNPPYGDYKDKYKGLGEGKDFDRYEEYFISKGLDALKDENSILAMVVPSGFLNSANDKQKEIIAEKGVLINAYRLPEGAFPSTQVGTDIVVFRKTRDDEISQSLIEYRAEDLSNNLWLRAYSSHVLGEVRTRTNRFGREETYVALPEGKTIDDMLSVISENIKKQVTHDALMRDENAPKQSETVIVKPSTYDKSLKTRKTIWSFPKEEENTVGYMLDYIVKLPTDFSLEKRDDGSFYIQGYDNGMKPRGRMTVTGEEISYILDNLVEQAKNSKKEFSQKDKDWWINRYNELGGHYTENKVVEEEQTLSNKEVDEMLSKIDRKEPLTQREETEFQRFINFVREQKALSGFTYGSANLSIEDAKKLINAYDEQKKTASITQEQEESHILYQRNGELGWEISAYEDFHKSVSCKPVYNIMGKMDANGYDIMETVREDSGFVNTRVIENLLNIDSWGEQNAKYTTLATFARDEANCDALGIEQPDNVEEFFDFLDKIIDTNSSQDIKDDLLNELIPEYAKLLKEQTEERQYTEQEQKWLNGINSSLRKTADVISQVMVDDMLQKIPSVDDKEAREIRRQIYAIENMMKEPGKHLKLTEEDIRKKYWKGWQLLEFQTREPNIREALENRWEKLSKIKSVQDVDSAIQLTDESISFSSRQDAIDYCLNMGSGFSGGKQRIFDFYKNNVPNPDSLKSFADMLKDEYGEGGRHFGGYNDYHNAKGIEIEAVINGQPEKISLTWGKAAREISGLISRGLYMQETVSETVTKDDMKETQFYKDFEAVIEDDDMNVDERYRYKDKYGLFKQDRILDAGTFSNFYFDNKLSAEDYNIWLATDWDGSIDIRNVDDRYRDYLNKSEKYVQTGEFSFMNVNFFRSGNIYQKLDELERIKESIPADIYENMHRLLVESKQSLVQLKDIKIPVHSNITEEFTVSRQLFGDVAELSINLKEDFKNWLLGRYLSDENQNYLRDWSCCNFTRDELPSNISWSDIMDYVNEKSVIARQTSSPERKRQAALEAQGIRDSRRETAEMLFDRYIHTGLTAEESSALEQEWNRRFNSMVSMDYSKLPLAIDGMRTFHNGHSFILTRQQVKGISFLLHKGNGLLAYDVGVGKTAAGIVAAVGQIQSGRSSRPLLLVPKSVYSKWINDVRELFPNIAVNELGNFSKNIVRNYYDGNHGLIIPEKSISICTHEALNQITFTKESESGPLFNGFCALLGKTEALHSKNARERATAIEDIDGDIGAASQVKNEGYIFFEKCGFDSVVVDEAHRFKNLFKSPRSTKVDGKKRANEFNGLGAGDPSKRAKKMFAITQVVQAKNGGRNVFMLTATPFTNNPLEIYSMLSYIGTEALRQRHIFDIRDFCNEYINCDSEWSVSPKSDITPKSVMKEFKSLSSLQNLLTQFIDKVDGEEAGVARPDKEIHKNIIEPTEIQSMIFEHEIARMDDPEERVANKGIVLEALGNMRMACVSPALLDPDNYPEIENFPKKEEFVLASPKMRLVCDTVINLWKNKPECGQVIYLPLGIEGTSYIKDYLIANGIPKTAIEAISGSEKHSEEKIDEIVMRFNDKKQPLKILIGGKKISEGMDLNGNSIVLYNTLIDWNPTESLQVEGRIWRQGNEQEKVHIVYPLLKDSVESLLMQKHDEKVSRINNIFDYKGGDALDVSSINPLEVKFDLITDPEKRADFIIGQRTAEFMKEEYKCTARIQTLESYLYNLEDIKSDIERYESYVKEYNNDLNDPNYEGYPPKRLLLEYIKDYKKSLGSYKTKLENSFNRFKKLGFSVNENTTVEELSAEIREKIREINREKHLHQEKIKNVENSRDAIIEAERARILSEKSETPSLDAQIQKLSEYIKDNTRYATKPQKSSPAVSVTQQEKTDTKGEEKQAVSVVTDKQVDNSQKAGNNVAPDVFDDTGNGMFVFEEKIPQAVLEKFVTPRQEKPLLEVNEDVATMFFRKIGNSLSQADFGNDARLLARTASVWNELPDGDRNKLVSVISKSADSEKAFASFIRKRVSAVRVSVDKSPDKTVRHDVHGR